MTHAAPLALLARDVMTREPVCVDQGAAIRQVVHTLDENEISGAPVVDEQGRIVGVVSKTDLFHRYAQGGEGYDPSMLIELFRDAEDDQGSGAMPEPSPIVDEFMTEDPITATETTPVATLARRMIDARIHRIIIIDKERRPIGIVTSLDLLRVIAGQG